MLDLIKSCIVTDIVLKFLLTALFPSSKRVLQMIISRTSKNKTSPL